MYVNYGSLQFFDQTTRIIDRIMEAFVVTDGVIRMRPEWRHKLWINFYRDRVIEEAVQVKDDDGEVFTKDIEDLRINNHSTIEYLHQFRHAITETNNLKNLKRLEICKVLFTAEKAKLLSDALSSSRCRVIELIFDRCRAKSDKMGMLFGALAHNSSISSLTLQNMNIPRDSLVAMVDLLASNRTVCMLTLLNCGLSDNSVNILSQGLHQNKNIIYLDLRQNSFEQEGFRHLLLSLNGQSLLTLRINGMLIESEDVQLLEQLFGSPGCAIKNLEMQELEVSDHKSQGLIEAIMKLDHLYTFNFSQNSLTPQMTACIVKMINKYQMLEIISTDHCEMTDVLFKTIFTGMSNSRLQFLNLSWNQLTGACMAEITNCLQQNQEMTKLCLHHNQLGTADMTLFAKEVGNHTSLKYLDISANFVTSVQFRKIYMAVLNSTSKIERFHCRKNKVGGPKIDEVLRRQNIHLCVLDLSSNKLTESNGQRLLDYVRMSIHIEQLWVNRNVQISAEVSNHIQEECHKNFLLKQKVLKYLQRANNDTISSNGVNEYDMSELSMTDTRLDGIDFIEKFVLAKQDECTTFRLKRIRLPEIQNRFSNAFSKRPNFLAKIRVLHLEELNIQKLPLRRLLKSIKNMSLLCELHIINIPVLEELMTILGHAITNHKKLKVLNIKQESFRTRDISALVPLLAGDTVLTDLDISKAIISQKNMEHLWVALHYNISVTDINYSRINFFALESIRAVDAELIINRMIKNKILPRVEMLKKLNPHSGSRELSLKGVQFHQSFFPAVVKYIKLQKGIQKLDLSETHLRETDIIQLVDTIASKKLNLTSLDLSRNDAVNDQVIKHMCMIFTSGSALKELYLNETKITMRGVKKLLEALRSNRDVRTISVEKCGLKLNGRQGELVLDLLKENICLTAFEVSKNIVNHTFYEKLDHEIGLNKSIVKHIFPQIKAQKELFIKRQQDNRRQRKSQKKVHRLSCKDKKSLVLPGRKTETNVEQLNSCREDLSMATKLKPLNSQKTQSKYRSIEPKPISSELPALESKNRALTPPPNFNEDSDSVSDDEEVVDSKSEMSSRFGDDSDANDEEQFDMTDLGNFNIKLGDCTEIAFMTKFMHVFPKIKAIDFGDHNMEEEQYSVFAEQLKLNKYIQNIEMKKKGVDKDFMKLMDQELKKNQQILDVDAQLSKKYDFEKTQVLDLNSVKYQDLSFLPKMINEFKALEVLDLSNSDLSKKSQVEQICKMIDENNTIKELRLSNCKLNGSALTMLADSLTKTTNENLTHLDFRENHYIQDPQLKVLFGLLQNNSSIRSIEYTLQDEHNHNNLLKLKEFHEDGMSTIEATKKIDEMNHSHHHHAIPLWQKIVFPIWLWKSLIHDKHEAFRFKYDTTAIRRVEDEIMPSVKNQLYLWSLVYYIITFALPQIAIIHDCGKTFESWLFVVYGLYLLLNSIWEVQVVFKIQKMVGKSDILQFNKWHFVELIMGCIARTDTFLDIAFIVIITNCWDTYLPWIIPTLTFACLNLIFPIVMLLKLIKTDFGNKLFQPYLESTCFAAFIRENMLLATVLDSFCINNSFYLLGKPFVFGKLMGFISFFTQDFPQLTVHVLFKLILLSEAQYKLKTQKLLLIGMCVSAMAVLISIFNMVMCSQNEFDPLVLETELQERRNADIAKDKDEKDKVKSLRRMTTTNNMKKDLTGVFRQRFASHKERVQSTVVEKNPNSSQIQLIKPGEETLKVPTFQFFKKKDQSIITRIKQHKEKTEVKNKNMQSYLGYLDEGQQEKMMSEKKSQRDSQRDSTRNIQLRVSDKDENMTEDDIPPQRLVDPRQKKSQKVHFAEDEEDEEDEEAETQQKPVQTQFKPASKIIMQQTSHTASQPIGSSSNRKVNKVGLKPNQVSSPPSTQMLIATANNYGSQWNNHEVDDDSPGIIMQEGNSVPRSKTATRSKQKNRLASEGTTNYPSPPSGQDMQLFSAASTSMKQLDSDKDQYLNEIHRDAMQVSNAIKIADNDEFEMQNANVINFMPSKKATEVQKDSLPVQKQQSAFLQQQQHSLRSADFSMGESLNAKTIE